MKKNILFILFLSFTIGICTQNNKLDRVNAASVCRTFNSLPKPTSTEFGTLTYKYRYDNYSYTDDSGTKYYVGTAVYEMSKKLCAPIVYFSNFEIAKQNVTTSFSISETKSISTYYGTTISNTLSISGSRSKAFKFGVSTSIFNLGVEVIPSINVGWEHMSSYTVATTEETSVSISKTYTITTDSSPKIYCIEQRGTFEMYLYYNYHYTVDSSGVSSLNRYYFDNAELGVGELKNTFNEVSYYTYDEDNDEYTYDISDDDNYFSSYTDYYVIR